MVAEMAKKLKWKKHFFSVIMVGLPTRSSLFSFNLTPLEQKYTFCDSELETVVMTTVIGRNFFTISLCRKTTENKRKQSFCVEALTEILLNICWMKING
jgi:hypothetical protein